MIRSIKTALISLLLALTLFGCAAPIQPLSDLPVTPVNPMRSNPIHRIQPVVVAASVPGQSVYHIDPARSQARYQVGERIYGQDDVRVIVGSTPMVRGDLMLDWSQPDRSRLGMVSVDANSLRSDSKLRDMRVRDTYLQSDRFPTVSFVPDHDAIPFPETLVEGEAVQFPLSGMLEARNIVRPVVWNVTLTATADEVQGSAELEMAMSDFAVGPISIAGLVETENWLTLHLDFVATVDPIASLDPQPASTLIPTEPVAGEPEFFADIAPILSAHCVSCHEAGRLGHALFPLETAYDAVSLADDLAFVVATGNMPPWPPSDDGPAFSHERKLNPNERNLIRRWADLGAPIDGDLSTPLTASTMPFEPIRSDVVMRTPTYLPDPSTDEHWRCYLFDPNLADAQMLTGYHIVPSNLLIAHHVTSSLYQRSDVVADIAALEAQDDQAGWDCLSGPFVGMAPRKLASAAYAVMPTWTPGAKSYHYPQGTGVALDEESVFIIQVHLNTTGGTGTIETDLHLQLADPHESLRTITGFDLYAPVEIPCPAPISTEACSREVALTGPAANRDWSETMLRSCDKTLDDYWGQSAENVVSDCDYRIDIDGELLVAYAHMHEYGRRFRLELNPDSDSAQIVLDIDSWDFNWQDHYWLRDPISVSAGDTVRITCTWDNSPLLSGQAAAAPFQDSRAAMRQRHLDRLVARLSGAQPVSAHSGVEETDYSYIVWGESTEDEMCIGSLAFLPEVGFEDVIPGDALHAPSSLWYRLTSHETWNTPRLLFAAGLAFGLIGIGLTLERRKKA